MTPRRLSSVSKNSVKAVSGKESRNSSSATASRSTVYLVGAGPGDPGLITHRGVYLLSQADVVLHDFLVHPNLLLHCPPHAQCINVGKRKGAHSKQQQDIHALILKYAKKGVKIVRLKGGDPCVFGRVGEEMAFLKQHGIAYEIVPGVTSATAVPAYAGIPLTHRDYSRSFSIITGTLKSGKDIDHLDIPKADTLVFLMGIHHLDHITDRLIREGYSPQTPVAILSRGTTADQKEIMGTLKTIGRVYRTHSIDTPSLIVVGKVVGLAASFGWKSQLPLHGKRLVLLRAQDQASDWAQQLGNLGAEVIQIPMIQTKENRSEMKKVTAKQMHPVTMILITSPNGARYFSTALIQHQLDMRCLAGKQIIAIGPKTASTLNTLGIIPDAVANDATSEGLLKILPETLTGECILIPTSTIAKPDLAQALQKRGATVQVLRVYQTVNTVPNVMTLVDGDSVLFTSASTADHFFASPLYQKQKINAFCIGPKTAAAVRKVLRRRVFVAAEPTLDGVVREIVNCN